MECPPSIISASSTLYPCRIAGRLIFFTRLVAGLVHVSRERALCAPLHLPNSLGTLLHWWRCPITIYILFSRLCERVRCRHCWPLLRLMCLYRSIQNLLLLYLYPVSVSYYPHFSLTVPFNLSGGGGSSGVPIYLVGDIVACQRRLAPVGVVRYYRRGPHALVSFPGQTYSSCSWFPKILCFLYYKTGRNYHTDESREKGIRKCGDTSTNLEKRAGAAAVLVMELAERR